MIDKYKKKDKIRKKLYNEIEKANLEFVDCLHVLTEVQCEILLTKKYSYLEIVRILQDQTPIYKYCEGKFEFMPKALEE